MPEPDRSRAMAVNPLIGHSPADTLENLQTCLHGIGEAMGALHHDPALQLLLDTLSGALAYEAHALSAGRRAA